MYLRDLPTTSRYSEKGSAVFSKGTQSTHREGSLEINIPIYSPPFLWSPASASQWLDTIGIQRSKKSVETIQKVNPPRHRAGKRKVETSCKRQNKNIQPMYILDRAKRIRACCWDGHCPSLWEHPSLVVPWLYATVSMGIFSRVENARERDATPMCPPCRHPHMMKSLRGCQREQVMVPVTHSNLTSLFQASESSCLGFCFCVSPDKDSSSSALTIWDTLEHYL